MIKRFLFPLLVLMVTAGVILYQFPHLPKNLAIDEVEFAKLALSLEGKPYTVYSTMATGHSTLYFYVILFFIKMFGITPLALRLPSAISGILCGILFYATIHIITKNRMIAFFATIVLVTSRWFFGLARFAFEPTFLLLLELSSVYFLSRYFQKKRHIDLIATGFFAGLAYNSYTSGRIYFLVPLFFLIMFLKKKGARILFYFLIPFIILITPLQTYLFTHEDIRIYQLSFFSNEKLSVQKKAEFLGQNIVNTAGMFFSKGDSNGKHNYPFKPALNPILGMFFIIGLYIGIKNWRNRYNQFFLLSLLISLLPTLLVYPWENPSMLRTYTALPSVAYFSVLPFGFVQQIKKITKKKIMITGIIFLMALSSLYELRTYFVYQSQVFKQSFEIKRSLNNVIHCPNVIQCKD